MNPAKVLIFPIWATVAAAQTGFLPAVLNWLPADTEVVYVSNTSISLKQMAERPVRWTSYAALAASALDTDEQSELGTLLRSLTFESAVFAGRHLHPIGGNKTALGLGAALDRCSFIQLRASDANSVARMLSSLPIQRSGADTVFQAKRPANKTGDPQVFTYFAWLGSGMLAACSDKLFLAEVASRKRTAQPRVALPGSLPEWNFVHRRSLMWGIRHYTKEIDPMLMGKDPAATGIAFEIASQSVAVVTHLSQDPNSIGLYLDLWSIKSAQSSNPSPGTVTITYDSNDDYSAGLIFRITMLVLGYVIAI